MLRQLLTTSLVALGIEALLAFLLRYQYVHGVLAQRIATIILMVIVGALALRKFVVASKRRNGDAATGTLYSLGERASKRPSTILALCFFYIFASPLMQGRTSVHEWWWFVTLTSPQADWLHAAFMPALLLVIGKELEANMGIRALLCVVVASAVGARLTAVVSGHDQILGASGAIYGLAGARAVLALQAFRGGFRDVAGDLFFATPMLVACNFLISTDLSMSSLIGPASGFVIGFLVGAMFGVPSALRASWELQSEAPSDVAYVPDARGRLFYNGPARYPLAWGWITPSDVVYAVNDYAALERVVVEYADPATTFIQHPLPDGFSNPIYAANEQKSPLPAPAGIA